METDQRRRAGAARLVSNSVRSVLVLGWVGCAAEPIDVPEGCQPLLGGVDCLLPYPSDFFLVSDPSMPSGHRVSITERARLRTEEGVSAQIQDFWAPDGFSRVTAMATVIEATVDPANLARASADPAASISPSSPTQILDPSGRRVPHFVDILSEGERTLLTLRPLVPLAAETRHVVVLRGLRDLAGRAITPTEPFRRLRDEEDVPEISDVFEEAVFPVIEKAGLDRSETQLAWAFTTGSREHPSSDLLEIRASTRAWLEAESPGLEVTSVEEPASGPMGRIIEGRFEAPWYLESEEATARLGQGVGRAWIPFRAQIPRSVLTSTRTATWVGFGHGFFESREAVTEGARTSLGEEEGLVLVSIDWTGFAKPDLGPTLDALASHPADFGRMTDRLLQAYANWMVLGTLAKNPMTTLPAFQRDGTCVYRPDDLTFFGVSAGHILSGALAAVSPDFERYGWMVGGAGISHIVSRSHPFGPLRTVLGTALEGPFGVDKFFLGAQEVLDRIDPATYADLAQHAPDHPPRPILMITGLGDSDVPAIGAKLHARALGLPLYPTSPVVPGLEVSGEDVTSAFSLYDFGVEPTYDDEADPFKAETPVHAALPRDPRARRQLGVFLREGRVVNTCGVFCGPP